MIVCVLVAQSCLTLCDFMDCSQLGYMGFPRQEYWNGLPCPSRGDPPNPGIKLQSPVLQADSLPSEPPGKPNDLWLGHSKFLCHSKYCYTAYFVIGTRLGQKAHILWLISHKRKKKWATDKSQRKSECHQVFSWYLSGASQELLIEFMLEWGVDLGAW